MAKKPIKDVVADLLLDFMEAEGYQLYNVEFVKEARDWFLRIYIDKTKEVGGYISTDDCEKVSRFLSDKLDESDPIGQNYYLEVSSPGMDRELVRDEHFQDYIGHQVDVNLYKAIDGQKQLTGQLLGLKDGDICILCQDKEYTLPRETVAKTRLAIII